MCGHEDGVGCDGVQVVRSSWRGSRDIEHIASAHHHAEMEVLKAVTRQRLRPIRACSIHV
jgi:hypothetical protein